MPIGGLSFEIFTIRKSDTHDTSFWRLSMAHQNNLSHVKGHIPIKEGVDKHDLGNSITFGNKKPNVVRWPFI